jgi:predicted RNA-binding protein YlqC (UPF0109 family)
VVAIKVSKSTGRRRAWSELMVPAADVDRAIGWPGTILS